MTFYFCFYIRNDVLECNEEAIMHQSDPSQISLEISSYLNICVFFIFFLHIFNPLNASSPHTYRYVIGFNIFNLLSEGVSSCLSCGFILMWKFTHLHQLVNVFNVCAN